MQDARVQKINLRDLYEVVLRRIGHHLVKNEIETNEFKYLDDFLVLFKGQVFPLYSKYVYRSKSISIYVTYANPYTFADPAPEIVSAVIPQSVYGLYIGEFMNFKFLSHVSYLSTKPMTRFSIAWRYEKPRLWVGYQGQVEVRAHWKLELVQDNQTGEWVVDVDPDTQDILVDLSAGYLMSAIGRSRRMVRIGDSNIEFDAEAMVAEGEELVKEARERLINLADITVTSF